MFSILDENVINVDKGIKKVIEVFQDVDRNEVKKFIQDIASITPVQKKKDHLDYKLLKEWRD